MESSHSQNIFMSKSFFRVSTRVLVTTALILGSYFSLAKSVLAQSAPAGTNIPNAAIGSFEGVTSLTSNPLTSNSVNFTVGSNPRLLLVKRITALNGGDINGFVDDLGTFDDNNANWPTPATFLRGAINGVSVAPGDELEYTIYFLSAGNTNVSNVTICDLIPPQTTFVNNTYGSGLGIALVNSATGLPFTFPTNISDGDKGRFYPAGSTPNLPAVTVCNRPNTAIPITIDDNTDGLVVVEVVKTSDPLPNFLPFATSAGTPPNSYGFVRFKVKVK